MAGARHFRELHCWQLANEFKLGIYRFADRPEVKRDFRFHEQIRDVAASAPRNIAEGLQDAVDRGYLDATQFARLNGLSERAAAATARLQRYLRGPQR
jgi:four helix bundle protein